MKKVERIINDLFLEFESRGADLKRMNAKDQHIIEEVSNKKSYLVWINNASKLTPHFINNAGAKYYGYNTNDLRKHGFKLYQNLIHPDHLNDINKTIVLADSHPKDTFEMTYRVKEKGGDWRWTYSITKALNFNKKGKAILVVAVVFDVADLVELCHFQHSTSNLDSYFAIDNRSLYNSLTKREVEILHLIAEDNTSVEVAALLNIEASTVDTHRKRIIKKLGVKSSLGLVKFALHFSNN